MTSAEDRKMEIAIGYMLRIGVTIAALVVLAGGVLYLVHFHGPAPDYRTFQEASPAGGIFSRHGAGHLSSLKIIKIGLLLLIATPVVRVIFCAVEFFRQKDKLYTLVSLTVLAVLLYSLLFHI